MVDSPSAWTEDARRRLRQAASAWGTQALLAAELRMHKNTLSNILSGDGEPGISKVAAIADKVGVSLDWVLTGRGPGVPSAAGGDELVQLPMLGATLSAGPGAVAATETVQATWPFPRSWLRRSFGHEDQLELLPVAGDSMEPELSDGDWVMVDLRRRDARDGLYAVRLEETLLVKRVQFIGRRVRLVSANPAYAPIDVDRVEGLNFELIGRVVWTSKLHVAAA